jgi:hypothetical protein
MDTKNQSGKGPSGLQLKIQSALTGVQQVLPSGSSIMIGGETATQAQLVTKLTGFLSQLSAVTDAKAAYTTVVQSRTAAETTMREYLAQLRGALVAFYGRNSPALGKFGMSAKTPAPQTTQTKIVAAAKRTLTRLKRGTLGTKQKASIKAVGTPQISIGESGVQIAPAAVAQPAAAPAASSPTPATPEPAGTPSPVTPDPATPTAK